jgi:beta-phosphoglucomutase-like phosphatase (HAD superfamily)
VTLVIFDCDGVLVDSEPISVRVDVELFAEVGLPMTEAEVIDRFVGRSPEVIVAAIEDQLGHGLPDGVFERAERRLRDAWATELTPVDGIVQALEQITDPVCVASSSTHDSLRYKLELSGLMPAG